MTHWKDSAYAILVDKPQPCAWGRGVLRTPYWHIKALCLISLALRRRDWSRACFRPALSQSLLWMPSQSGKVF